MKKLIIILICLLTTGCYNYTELTDLGITSSILIDYKDEYIIIVEVIDDEESLIINGTGSDITTALENVNNKIDKEIYLTHLNTIFITKNIKYDELAYYILRNPTINENFYISLVNDDFALSDGIGYKVSNILKNNRFKTFYEITQDYINNKKDILIPLYDDEIKSYYSYKDEYFELLNIDEYNVYRILNKINNTNIKFDYDDSYYVLTFNKIKITNNQIELNATINEFNIDLDTTNTNDLRILENNTNNILERKCNDLIEKLNENNIKLFDIDNIKVITHINKKGLLLK